MFGSSVPNGILTSFSGTIIKDMGALLNFGTVLVFSELTLVLYRLLNLRRRPTRLCW